MCVEAAVRYTSARPTAVSLTHNMAHMTSTGPLKVLGHVTLIVAVPLLGGAIAGIVLDAILGTSPLFVLSGFAAGNLVAIVGVGLYIRANRGFGSDGRERVEDDSERS
jgi:F0F1-type ATP synthase assembly protein I